MWSARLDEYQYAVGRDDNLFLLRGDGRVLVLAQFFWICCLTLSRAASSVAAWVVILGKSGTWAVQPSAESVQSTG